MIFVARQVQEKCEMCLDLCIALVDQTEAAVHLTEICNGTFHANLAALPHLLHYNNNSIPAYVLKLSWLVLSPPAFLFMWK